MDIASWLAELGLERFEPAFRENRIDGEILPRLTADDLKDLGVVLVGDRRRLLDAIDALRGGKVPAPSTDSIEGIPASSRVTEPVASTDRAPIIAGALATGERRHLIVMFCDLVGSTEIAARLYLSRATVRNHVAATLRALGAHTRLEAAAVARRQRLL